MKINNFELPQAPQARVGVPDPKILYSHAPWCLELGQLYFFFFPSDRPPGPIHTHTHTHTHTAHTYIPISAQQFRAPQGSPGSPPPPRKLYYFFFIPPPPPPPKASLGCHEALGSNEALGSKRPKGPLRPRRLKDPTHGAPMVPPPWDPMAPRDVIH